MKRGGEKGAWGRRCPGLNVPRRQRRQQQGFSLHFCCRLLMPQPQPPSRCSPPAWRPPPEQAPQVVHAADGVQRQAVDPDAAPRRVPPHVEVQLVGAQAAAARRAARALQAGRAPGAARRSGCGGAKGGHARGSGSAPISCRRVGQAGTHLARGRGPRRGAALGVATALQSLALPPAGPACRRTERLAAAKRLHAGARGRLLPSSARGRRRAPPTQRSARSDCRAAADTGLRLLGAGTPAQGVGRRGGRGEGCLAASAWAPEPSPAGAAAGSAGRRPPRCHSRWFLCLDLAVTAGPGPSAKRAPAQEHAPCCRPLPSCPVPKAMQRRLARGRACTCGKKRQSRAGLRACAGKAGGRPAAEFPNRLRNNCGVAPR